MSYLLTFPSGRSLLLLRGRGLLRLGGGVHDNRRGGDRGRELGLCRVIRPGWEKTHKRKCYKDLLILGEKNCGWQSEAHFKSLLNQLKWNPQKLTAQNTELSVIHRQVNVHKHTHTPSFSKHKICHSQNYIWTAHPQKTTTALIYVHAGGLYSCWRVTRRGVTLQKWPEIRIKRVMAWILLF